VKHCASELCLSPSYFGDVVRNATGENPTRIIQRFLIERAKSLMIGGMTVAQAANELGFEYPQHFTRYFKKHVGMTPSGYVASMRKQ
jgi:AraC-like DNA-binding protein